MKRRRRLLIRDALPAGCCSVVVRFTMPGEIVPVRTESEMAKQKHEPGPPMDLANMRQLGCR